MNQELDDISEEVLKDDETLMQYLRGNLSAEDEAAFMQKIQQNPDLKDRAIAVARLIKGLERKGVSQDENFKSAFQKLSEAHVQKIAQKSGKSISIKRFFAWAIASAAVLVLVFGLSFFYVNSANEKLAAEYENDFPLSDVSRGVDDMDAELKPLFDNVLQGKDLNNTIEKLTVIFEQSQSETFNNYTNYFEISGWYLSLAHLKNHDAKKAKSVLKTLIKNSEDSSAIRNKAEEVLEKIK